MRILLVEDETLSALGVAAQLERAGYTVIGPARSSGEALLLARDQRPTLAFVGIDLESEGAGVRLAQILSTQLDMRCVLSSDEAQDNDAAARSAFAIVEKCDDPQQLEARVQEATRVLRASSGSTRRTH